MIGKTISHYKIIEKLGEGGMGIVYKAQDLKLDRFVALKFLPSSLTRDAESKKRFIQEAKSASALDHNNICSIYEVDETEDDQLFISMGYYEGKTLKQNMKEKPLDVGEVLNISMQIAKGLQKAHEKDIIHRDIKPDNIFITNDDVVKILDFGLAKIAGQNQLTQLGSTYGTISYMSPEQTTGGIVDHRTDIWSLGVIIYEMLTGQLPFKGEYEHAISYSIINELPQMISEVTDRLPNGLEDMVGKCLQKKVDARYQNMNDLTDDLKAISKGVNPNNLVSELSQPGRALIKPHYTYLGVFIILIAVIIYLTNPFSNKTDVIESIAILPLENLSGDAEQEYFVDGMTDALISKLAQISSLRVISRTSVMRYKEARKSIQEIANELNVDALVEGTVLYDGDQIRITVQLIKVDPEQNLWANDYKRKLYNIIELQGEVAQSIAREINVTVTPDEELRLVNANIIDPEVYKLYLKGQYNSDKSTSEGIKRSQEYYKQALDKDPNFALAYAGLAENYLQLGLWTGFPEETLSEFRTAAEKAIELDNSQSDIHRMNSMIKFWHEWDVKGAEIELKKALELNPNSARAHDLYCNVLIVLGRFDEAIAERELAMELDPLSHMIHCNGCYTYFVTQEYDKAIEQARMTTAQFGSACSFEDLMIGASYTQKAEYDSAITVLEKRKVLSKNNSRLLGEIAYAYALSGQFDKSKSTLKELSDLGDKRQGHPYYYLSAITLAALGDKDKAIEYLDKSMEKREWVFPWIKVDQRLSSLRFNPQFIKIVEQLDY